MNLSQWNQGKDIAIRKGDQTISNTTNTRNEGYRKGTKNSCAKYLINIGVLEENYLKKNIIHLYAEKPFLA